MARADDYRRYAAECLALAQRAEAPADRARLLEMAHDWNELAVKASRLAPTESPTEAEANSRDTGRDC